MRKIVLLVAAVAFALMPAVAGAQTQEEIDEAVAALRAAVDDLSAEDLDEWQAKADAVQEALNDLDNVAGAILDLEDLQAALDGLNVAIAGGDLDQVASAAEAVSVAMDAVEAAAADAGTGGDAPAGGVATGGGGTAGHDLLPVVLISAGVLAAAAGAYVFSRRSEDVS